MSDIKEQEQRRWDFFKSDEFQEIRKDIATRHYLYTKQACGDYWARDRALCDIIQGLFLIPAFASALAYGFVFFEEFVPKKTHKKFVELGAIGEAAVMKEIDMAAKVAIQSLKLQLIFLKSKVKYGHEFPTRSRADFLGFWESKNQKERRLRLRSTLTMIYSAIVAFYSCQTFAFYDAASRIEGMDREVLLSVLRPMLTKMTQTGIDFSDVFEDVSTLAAAMKRTLPNYDQISDELDPLIATHFLPVDMMTQTASILLTGFIDYMTLLDLAKNSSEDEE